MLISEAKRVGGFLARLPESAFPLANIGCQTWEFQTVTQPWIQEFVFAPMEHRGVQTVNVDIRRDDAVDIVADVTTAEGQAAIRHAGARSVLCANLLEHVPDAQVVIDALVQAVPIGGYLLLSGPLSFPYHPDPIDTMFRPTWKEMAQRIGPDFEICLGEDVICHRLAYYEAMRPHGRIDVLARVALPFVKPRSWRQRVRSLFSRTSAYVLAVRRLETASLTYTTRTAGMLTIGLAFVLASS